jgi:hypothetical protein
MENMLSASGDTVEKKSSYWYLNRIPELAGLVLLRVKLPSKPIFIA